MDERITYRAMKSGEEEAVCRLVDRVFDEFVAPDFEPQGVEEFLRFANPRSLAERCAAGYGVIVATRGDELVGMIEINDRGHIAMLFVTQRGKGIAKELVGRGIDRVTAATPGLAEITVHASLYARPVYERLGFELTGQQRTENGITYLPMARRLAR